MSGPVCPWCGDEADDSPEQIPFSPGTNLVLAECGGCDQPITIHRTIIVSYIARKRTKELEP